MLGRRANSDSLPRVIMHTSEPSGLGHYVSKLVLALAASGVPVVQFCPANSSDEEDVRAAGVEIVHAAVRDVSKAGLLARLLRNFRFLSSSVMIQSRLVRRTDVVHFQGMLHLPLGFVFLLLAALRGGSIVLTAHDPLPHRWRLGRGLRWMERSMLQFSYRLCDRIIVHNKAGKEVLVREFHQQEDSIFVIPHGWYSDAADANQSYPQFDCLSLLAFGSIRENKGLHLAIQAVQMASDSRLPVRLTIAGHCDAAEEQYWEMCKELIALNPAGINVIDRAIADDEVKPLIARHHALILPYTKFFSESGVATLALSHRRPILATTQGGLGELIEQSECGIPIISPDVPSIFKAILEASAMGPEKLKAMGIAGNSFMRKARSWDCVARQTAEVYSRIAATRITGIEQPMISDAWPGTSAGNETNPESSSLRLNRSNTGFGG